MGRVGRVGRVGWAAAAGGGREVRAETRGCGGRVAILAGRAAREARRRRVTVWAPFEVAPAAGVGVASWRGVPSAARRWKAHSNRSPPPRWMKPRRAGNLHRRYRRCMRYGRYTRAPPPRWTLRTVTSHASTAVICRYIQCVRYTPQEPARAPHRHHLTARIVRRGVRAKSRGVAFGCHALQVRPCPSQSRLPLRDGARAA